VRPFSFHAIVSLECSSLTKFHVFLRSRRAARDSSSVESAKRASIDVSPSDSRSRGGSFVR
jgi:hypothetical protein